MDDLNIIDRFTDTFSRYIDSGFGLLAGDVAFLTSVMVGIDIVLAGVLWALHGEDNVPAQLIRKVLYVGFFALLLNNFQSLSRIHSRWKIRSVLLFSRKGTDSGPIVRHEDAKIV